MLPSKRGTFEPLPLWAWILVGVAAVVVVLGLAAVVLTILGAYGGAGWTPT